MDDSIERGPRLVGAEESTAHRLDAQLASLAMLAWATEAAARREDRAEPDVKYRLGFASSASAREKSQWLPKFRRSKARQRLGRVALAMLASMVIPMAAFMRVRGNNWERTAEMSGAMTVPTAAILAASLLGLIPHRPALSIVGGGMGVPMWAGMLGAMTLRWR